MDYTKPLPEIIREFNKRTLGDQWQELKWMQEKIKAGNIPLQPIYNELLLRYSQNQDKAVMQFLANRKT